MILLIERYNFKIKHSLDRKKNVGCLSMIEILIEFFLIKIYLFFKADRYFVGRSIRVFFFGFYLDIVINFDFFYEIFSEILSINFICNYVLILNTNKKCGN